MNQLACDLDIPPGRISGPVNGKRNISADQQNAPKMPAAGEQYWGYRAILYKSRGALKWAFANPIT